MRVAGALEILLVDRGSGTVGQSAEGGEVDIRDDLAARTDTHTLEGVTSEGAMRRANIEIDKEATQWLRRSMPDFRLSRL